MGGRSTTSGWEIFGTFDLRGERALISAPTLAITGRRTSSAGRCARGKVADGIKGSRKVVVGDSGHMIFVEKPEVFEREVAEFLES